MHASPSSQEAVPGAPRADTVRVGRSVGVSRPLAFGIAVLCLLPLSGLTHAIAAPAPVSQHTSPEAGRAEENLNAQINDLAKTYAAARAAGLKGMPLLETLEQRLKANALYGALNPYSPGEPAYDFHVQIHKVTSEAALAAKAEAAATTLGVGVFVLGFSSDPDHSELIAGAVRVMRPGLIREIVLTRVQPMRVSPPVTAAPPPSPAPAGGPPGSGSGG